MRDREGRREEEGGKEGGREGGKREERSGRSKVGEGQKTGMQHFIRHMQLSNGSNHVPRWSLP